MNHAEHAPDSSHGTKGAEASASQAVLRNVAFSPPSAQRWLVRRAPSRGAGVGNCYQDVDATGKRLRDIVQDEPQLRFARNRADVAESPARRIESMQSGRANRLAFEGWDRVTTTVIP